MANWSSNLILVDADYLDRVVFDMTVHFEPVIGRSLPQADLCHWLDCIALDGGLREGANEVQVVFIHSSRFRWKTLCRRLISLCSRLRLHWKAVKWSA